MRILFFIRHDGFIRNFEAVLTELAARGHEVHLGVGGQREALMSEASSFDELHARFGITHDRLPRASNDGYGRLFDRLCAARDHIRFLRPEYDAAPKLRARAAANAPAALRRLLDIRGARARSTAGLNAIDAVLRRAIHATPIDPAISEYLDARAPDVVLFTPLVGFGGTQHPYLLGAVRKGLPTALLLHSWDNLTNKGLIHVHPDRVLVWNEEQRDEAISLHGIDSDRIVVTGAHSYDHWFDWGPTKAPAEFRAELGLDPGRKVLLYVGSSKFIAPNEAAFFASWLQRLRASAHPVLRDAIVVVRPHPQNAAHWQGLDLGDPGRTVIWPPLGSTHSGLDARGAYYDSIHHAAAIVGINTSALVESAIIGTPAYTILAPEFRNTQEGTLHFAHLAGAQGILTTASTFDEHFDQLAAALEDDQGPRARQQAFVARFLRPLGGTPTPAARVANAVEAAAGLPRRPATAPPRLARLLLAPSARYSRRVLARTPPKRAGSWGGDLRDTQGLRLLLFMRSADDDRHVASLLRSLLAGGARVHVALDKAQSDGEGGSALVGELAREFPRLTSASGPKRRQRRWAAVAEQLRHATDHRYLEPDSFGRNALGGMLLSLERALPIDAAITSYIQEYDPDVVLVTPLDGSRSLQGDVIRAAAGLGRPTTLLMPSSDDLTDDRATHKRPDRTIAWNEEGAAARAVATIQELAAVQMKPRRRPLHHAVLALALVSLLRAVAGVRRNRHALGFRGKRSPARTPVAGEGRRILFVLDHPGLLIHFDETINELARRGHTAHIAFGRPRRFGWAVEALDLAGGRIVVHSKVPKRTDRFAPSARRSRGVADYVHYLAPSLAAAVYSRAKWRELASLPLALRPLARRETLGKRTVDALLGVLSAVERATPTDGRIDRFVAEIAPDLLLVSPLVDARSDQTDYLKSARALGIPSGLCVTSWDNLSSKGLIRYLPDRVFVWNDVQAQEAVDYHHVPRDRIVVTGAQPFDRWFVREPSVSRAEFCASVELPDDRPFALFVGSTLQNRGEDEEVELVRRWVTALRASGDPIVRDLPVLVRPHPRNTVGWRDARLEGLGTVALWRRDDQPPIAETERAAYYDGLHYAQAILGVNSSAMIEAAIVGRPVHTIALPELRPLQRDLLHFHYLLEERGGFLREAVSFEEHVDLLARDLRFPEPNRVAQAHFVRSFIRPHGVDRAAMPLLVDAIERAASISPGRSDQASWRLFPLRIAVVGNAVGRQFVVGGTQLAERATRGLGLERRGSSPVALEEPESATSAAAETREPERLR